MNIEVQKSKTAQAVDVLVDGKRWGWFERYSHGPQGNSYSMRQVGGYTVRDEGFRKALTVHGDKMTKRLIVDRPWHSAEFPIEQRLLIAAQYAVSKSLLKDPAEIDAEARAKREAIEREERAQKAKQRMVDMAVGMGIADACYPPLDDGYREHLDKLRLASLIADEIEKARRW